MESEIDLEDVEEKICKIRSPFFYRAIFVFFSFVAWILIFYALYHEYNLIYFAVGGIWFIAGIAVYVIGYILNYYKNIVEKLIREIKNNR